MGSLRIRNGNINELLEEINRRDKFNTQFGIDDDGEDTKRN